MMNMGWICPKCGRVHNPNVAFCYCSIAQKSNTYNLHIELGDLEEAAKLKKVFDDLGPEDTSFSGVLN